MFTIYDKAVQQKPIRVWLESRDQLEEGCLQQAVNLSNLPFVRHWVALMPDTHQGYGMPIGGVAALKDVIIPNAVGVDIGCGVAFAETSVHKSQAGEGDFKSLVKGIMDRVPLGFDHHKVPQKSEVLDRELGERGKEYRRIPELVEEIYNGYYQVGTLGGGNHFIEIQEDQQGKLCIMVHSGSRNFGYKIANYFNHLAREFNKRADIRVPESYQLAYLPVDSREGQEYILWMTLALKFARENRQRILDVVKGLMEKRFPGIRFSNEINAHHNYASLETHFGEELWVHRKGAIRAGKGELGIIPGSMGSFSYIVEGLGNPESFCSCSHGAGRVMSRNEAKQSFSKKEVVEDLKKLGVYIGAPKKSQLVDECRFAYKDIDFVISQQSDLVRPVKKMKTLLVVKG